MTIIRVETNDSNLLNQTAHETPQVFMSKEEFAADWHHRGERVYSYPDRYPCLATYITHFEDRFGIITHIYHYIYEIKITDIFGNITESVDYGTYIYDFLSALSKRTGASILEVKSIVNEDMLSKCWKDNISIDEAIEKCI